MLGDGLVRYMYGQGCPVSGRERKGDVFGGEKKDGEEEGKRDTAGMATRGRAKAQRVSEL
jgi:hypothetical protein